MSGECNVCGQNHVEINHCAFKSEIDDLRRQLAASEDLAKKLLRQSQRLEQDKFELTKQLAESQKAIEKEARQ